MDITMLVDNKKNKGKINLINENGLSIIIARNGNKILFDTGKSKAVLKNAKELGVDLKEIDYVVISNTYKDHSGGLLRFLEINRKAKIYIKSESEGHYGVQLWGITKRYNIDKKIFAKYIERIIFVDKVMEISKDVFLVPDILKYYSLAKVSRSYVKVEKNEIKLDDYKHELFMVIKKNEEINLFVGCGYNGVISMIETTKKIFGDVKINSLIGGLHLEGLSKTNLYKETDEEVTRLAKYLKEYNIKSIYTCHCVNMKQIDVLKKVLDNKIEYFSLGTTINL